MSVLVEISGLEVGGRHGVGDDERSREQTFLVDVEMTVDEPAADDIGVTADYRIARDVVRRVSAGASFSLLETFAAAVADALLEALQVAEVRVRIRKPGIAWADWTAATVVRRAGV